MKIAFSTAKELRIPYYSEGQSLLNIQELRNDKMTPLFEAVIEATEEAILNSMFTAKTTTGKNGRTIEKLPVDRIIDILDHHNIVAE